MKLATLNLRRRTSHPKERVVKSENKTLWACMWLFKPQQLHKWLLPKIEPRTLWCKGRRANHSAILLPRSEYQWYQSIIVYRMGTLEIAHYVSWIFDFNINKNINFNLMSFSIDLWLSCWASDWSVTWCVLIRALGTLTHPLPPFTSAGNALQLGPAIHAMDSSSNWDGLRFCFKWLKPRHWASVDAGIKEWRC